MKLSAGLVVFAVILPLFAPATPAWAAEPLPTLSPATTQESTGATGPAEVPSAGLVASKPQSDPITDDVPDTPASVRAGASSWDHLGTAVAALGDLNGDGTSEVGAVSRNPWALNIFLGTRGGFSSGDPLVLKGSPGDLFGTVVAGGRDLNGDNLADIAVAVGQPDSGTGTYRYHVAVYYGSPTFTSGLQNAAIPAPSMASSFGSGVALLKDADGDGYDDLLVSAASAPGSGDRGKVWLYRGSPYGMRSTPDWTYTARDAGDGFGALALDGGDLNGDGYGDFVVTTGGTTGADGRCQVFVFYGSRDLRISGPTVIKAESFDDGFGSSASAGDFNGDGKTDLIVGAPDFDSNGEMKDAGRAYEFRGSNLGIATVASTTRTGSPGSKFASFVSALGDLNGDNYEDAGVAAPLASADGPVTNGQVFVYFGGASGLATRYDFTEAGQAGNDLYGASFAGRFDLDGDGRTDIGVGAPGQDLGGLLDTGALYLYSGAAILMPAIRSDALVIAETKGSDAKVLARAADPYHFTLTFVYRGLQTRLSTVEITLVSSGLPARVPILWDARTGKVTSSDPRALVELAPSSHLVAGGPYVHSFQLIAVVKFAWSFSDPNPLGVECAARDYGGASATRSFPNSFSVVSSLSFSRPFSIERSDGSPVLAGGFVRASDTLSWSGGGLVYTGTGVIPPSTEFSLTIRNDTGAVWAASFDPATGDLVATTQADRADDPADLHQVNVMANTGEQLAAASFLLKVDGLPVAFERPNYATGSTVPTETVDVALTVKDSGSGVDSPSVEWSISHTDPASFTKWQPASVTGSGSSASASARVALERGPNNFITFRARDVVGNGPTMMSPPVRLTLDPGAIVFEQLAPGLREWSRSSDVSATFLVSNDLGNSLDLASIEYSVDPADASAGDWMSVGLSGQSPATSFTLAMHFPDAPDNAVYLRARLAGLPQIIYSQRFTYPVDTASPRIEVLSPTPEAWSTSATAVSTIRVLDPTSGPDTNAIRYRYLLPSADSWSDWLIPEIETVLGGLRAKGVVPAIDGVDNFVVWTAFDRAGNGPVSSGYLRILADLRPVTFENPYPSDGAHLPAVTRISIDVSDADGSGVLLSSIEVRIDLPTGSSTGWVSADRQGIVSRATVALAVELPPGTSMVQWRGRDFAGTPVAVSAPAAITVQLPGLGGQPPRLVLRTPAPDAHYPAGVDIRFDASDSLDPDGDVLRFKWQLDGHELSEKGSTFWMSLAPGVHTLTLVVSDGVNPATKTVQFYVDPPVSAPGPLATLFEQGLVAACGALLTSVLLFRRWALAARRQLER